MDWKIEELIFKSPPAEPINVEASSSEDNPLRWFPPKFGFHLQRILPHCRVSKVIIKTPPAELFNIKIEP